jgi:uncharacterized protein (TIGR02466 family)
MKSEIIPIFSTPIYITKLDRPFSQEEMLFVNKTKNKTQKNESNVSSIDSYILNNQIFNKIKNEITLHLNNYLNEVINPKENLQLYITQSWLNYTETNQHHHKHQHPNSLISGVLYISCDEQFDKIKFFNTDYKTIKPEIKEWNIWNSETWWFHVKTGDIILFPSSLSHMVEAKEGNNTRISLSFNTFIKGKIGNKKELTELYL